MAAGSFTILDAAVAGDVTQSDVDSVDFDALVAGISGLGVMSGCAVTQNGAGAMSVVVAGGQIQYNLIASYVTGATVTVGANASGQDRFDLIVVSSTGVVSVVAGTPGVGTGLVFPAIPLYSILLAAVRVPNGVAAILTAHITDKRVLVPGQPLANAMAAIGRLRTFGHSWAGSDGNAGPWAADGKADRQLARMLKLPGEAVENYARSGSELSSDYVPGGWVNVARRLNPSAALNSMGRAGAPYVGRGSAYINMWPAQNDMSQANTIQVRNAYMDTAQAVICRQRCAFFSPSDGYLVFTVGAGFVPQTQTAWNSGQSILKATVIGGTSTITYSLPSDYTGQRIFLFFVGMPGTTGGAVNISGTAAGASGSISTSNRQITGLGHHSYCVKILSGMTAADAGKTIIITTSAMDAGGSVYFDGLGIEADNPPLVLWANAARLLASGYTFYGNVFGDADVATWNSALTTMITSSFTDNLVRIVDVDSVMGKSTTMFSTDGVHPSERGHYGIALAALNVIQQSFVPLNATGNAPLPMGLRRGCKPGEWYTSDAGGTLGSVPTTLNDLTASPFFNSEWTPFDTAAIDVVTLLAASKLRVGLYFSDETQAFPGLIYTDFGDVPTTAAGYASTLALATNFWFPPGLMWIVGLVTGTAGATVRTLNGQNMWMPNNAGIGLAAGWLASGFTGGALPNVFPITAVVNATKIPRIALKASPGRTF